MWQHAKRCKEQKGLLCEEQKGAPPPGFAVSSHQLYRWLRLLRQREKWSPPDEKKQTKRNHDIEAEADPLGEDLVTGLVGSLCLCQSLLCQLQGCHALQSRIFAFQGFCVSDFSLKANVTEKSTFSPPASCFHPPRWSLVAPDLPLSQRPEPMDNQCQSRHR